MGVTRLFRAGTKVAASAPRVVSGTAHVVEGAPLRGSTFMRVPKRPPKVKAPHETPGPPTVINQSGMTKYGAAASVATAAITVGGGALAYNRITGDIKDVAKGVGDTLAEGYKKAGDLGSSVAHEIDDLGTDAVNAGTHIYHKGSEMAGDAVDAVKGSSITYILIAGVGVFIAYEMYRSISN